MSLRRSARARLPASDLDATTPGSAEKRKRKRSTMTPEASQSPGKAAGSPLNDNSNNHHHQQEEPSSSSPTAGRTSSRKIVVKNVRGGNSLQGEMKDMVPESNGTMSLTNLKAEKQDEADEELQELCIGDDDKEKLETVLKVYAPELLTKIVEQASRKQNQPFQTLQQALSQPQCSIRSVRDHILALRSPLTTASALRGHLSSSHISPPKEDVDNDRRRLSMMTMVLALVDEIGSRTRNGAEKVDVIRGTSGGKQGDDEYALNMRLPTGDYFTNAIRLSKREALQLDAGNSKLVSVASQPLSLDTRPPPTLKERLQPAKFRKKTINTAESVEEDVSKPVSHLYYGPWSSFAPSYDSFDGNLSMKASCALWRARKKDRKTLEKMIKEPPSERQQLEETLASLEDIDAQVVLREYDELKAAPNLENNARLIEKLDQLQEQRWKRTFAKRLLAKKDIEVDEPSKEERQIAGEILDTLTHLLSNHSGSLTGLIPASDILQAASNSACIDPALLDGVGEPGYWGSLNETLFGPEATRRVMGARSTPIKPPGAIKDNETIRMEPANEEKASINVAQTGASLKGKGLLDRFAVGRQYSLVDHPHDRKLVVAGSQQQGPPPSQPAARPPMGPNMTPYRSAMSPPHASTPPARPYHPQMRPSPGTPTGSYIQQSPQPPSAISKMAYYRPPTSQSPRAGAWPQPSPVSQQSNHAYYPTTPSYSAGRPPPA